MLFIKHVLRIPLRMSDEMLLVGDDAVHGEAAYSLADDVDLENLEPESPGVSTVLQKDDRKEVV